MSNLHKAYLFDLDGTLVDTAGDLTNSLNFVLSEYNNTSVHAQSAKQWVGSGAKAMIRRALATLDLPVPSDDAVDDMHRVFVQHYEDNLAVLSRPYPTVVETLERLVGHGIPLGVVTNKWYALSYQLLKELDLYRFFYVLVGGDTLQVNKPAAEPALYACNELNVRPEETLFVGDSISDVGCARAAGCPVVVFADGYAGETPAEQLGADRVIQSFAELI